MKLTKWYTALTGLGIVLGACDSEPGGVALYKDGTSESDMIAMYPQKTAVIAHCNCEFHKLFLERMGVEGMPASRLASRVTVPT